MYPQPIKILHIITGLGKGGAETMLFKLLKYSHHRFSHQVISLTGSGYYFSKYRELGVPVHIFSLKNPFSLLFQLIKLRSFVIKLRPDIIQSWMYHANFFTFLILKKEDSPIIWNIRHSLHKLDLEKLFTRIIIILNKIQSSGTVQIVYNSNIARIQHERFGFNRTKSEVIPNGFDTVQFCPSKEGNTAVRLQYKIPAVSFVIGLVARFHPLKDYNNFLTAFGILLKRMPHQDLTAVMVGKGNNSSNRELVCLIRENNIEDNVILIEESNSIPSIMQALDILCLSSSSEAFPNVVGEAMATGVPCVVTDVGETSFVVDNTGIIVPPQDPHALADGFYRMIQLSKVERINLGIKARERILQFFSIDKITEKYEFLYKKTLNILK